MRVPKVIGAAAAILTVAACATAPGYVPLPSPGENLVALGGEWRGEYSSPTTGRSGTLYFALTPSDEAAEGEIVLFPGGASAGVKWRNTITIAAARHLAEPLAVQFVSFESGIVTARVGPYVDVNCGNLHVTTFFGELRNGRITGNFVSRSHAHEPQTGEWRATRVR